MDDKKIIALIEGYSAGTLNEEDTIAFFQWYSDAGLDEFHRIYAQCNLATGAMPANPQIPDDFKVQLEQAIQDYETNQQQPRTISLVRRYRLGWAAAILLLIGAGGYFIYQSRQPVSTEVVNNQQPSSGDVAPGTTKAVLTLADGRQVTIDSVRSGTLAVQGKTMVQHDQGAITYNGNSNAKGQNATQSVLYNTLTTNRGEQSPPLVLSDGTKVWLNALSSIRFPVAFTGSSRNVEITGEVFFEVAKNASRPFHVKVKDMEVEVLGTQFNVNAYDDEPVMKTTLLEGKVKVSSTVNGHPDSYQEAMLKPGEQASISQQNITIQTANVGQAIAWKSGLFDFNHLNLQTVLRQLSRWYDIEVKFEGDIPQRTFRGKMGKDLNLSQVTQALQKVDIKFRIEGKTLIVTQ
jgi:transmembrane sensor